MSSFSAVALLLLAVTTGCFGAQSERTRQRSGPIRSVPVAADIKRDNNFDCPEEFGYYPHPNDCTLYYVCVFGGALLESCTGGLMYSHELQTCDWPRNVGCDATGAIDNDDLERLNERESRPPPPPPPPRRTPPPPPPRAQPQPNPIITSRGQPRFNRERDEYEKQQQLYAEIDDLPPVEEIESDRQQRVYRGQPSTIGQVQKDRDGYINQAVSSGRTLNSNIIPASIPQNSGKVGSFSFGTQIDERRTATVSPAPHTYSVTKIDQRLDFDRQFLIETNEIDLTDNSEKHHVRSKRDVSTEQTTETNTTENTTEINFTDSDITTISNSDKMSKRSDDDDEVEYYEFETESTPENDEELSSGDDSERGKRQVRYLLKNGFKTPSKNWASSKPIKFIDLQQLNYNSNGQISNTRFQHNINGINNNNNAYDVTRKPDSSLVSSANPFASIQYDNPQSQRPFKASLPDPFSRFVHSPMNTATHIITKSPPISSLKNNENPFSALAGGFYNNVQSNRNQNGNHQPQFFSNLNHNQLATHDSSHHSSSIVTGKPRPVPTSNRPQNNYRLNNNNGQSNVSPQMFANHKKPQEIKMISQQQLNNRPYNTQTSDDDDDDEESSEEDSSESNDDDIESPSFPDPPYEFSHPSNKYVNIENPFAHPNFDFDAFLAKLRDDHYSVVGITTAKPQANLNIVKPSGNSDTKSTTLSYKGMSTPRPFSSLTVPAATTQNAKNTDHGQHVHKFPANHQQISQQHNNFSPSNKQQQSAATPLESVRPKLKPPNFKDERQLPLNFNFDKPIDVNGKHKNNQTQLRGEAQQIFSVSQKPYIFLTSTGSPIFFSSPKQQFMYKPDKIYSLQPQLVSTGRPHQFNYGNFQNSYNTFKVSTQRPSPVNEQLSILQQFWKNLSTEPNKYAYQSSPRPNSVSELPKLENLFVNTVRPTGQFPNNHNFQNIIKEPTITTTTTQEPPKRKPIPKPSPEMNDYYYDDDEQYFEPPVKPKYMPSSEVRPKRPPMAQNDQEYDDHYERDTKPKNPTTRFPSKFNNYKQESITKNHNDVSAVTKAPHKEPNKNGKIPAMIDHSSAVIMRPEISDYRIVHHTPRNRTFIHLRKPVHSESGPYTQKPPKYLNQTTLRPYTVRHRLAKPTTMKITTMQNADGKQTRGRLRHQNIVAQMKVTTTRDSNRQESRLTKSKHDDKTNSLEPTENVTPSSYVASPRPKMLYNGSQSYAPEQFDPYYAVYDEDGELYKDTDYVQHYNTASLRPAVHQTYRGTPPPARRPIESYTPRPSSDDYDDALIQGQINNPNQYQSPIRHSTRGEGNELGYNHIPSSVRTTLFEATSISTTPSTTTSTSTTTQRPTIAPFTEAITPSRYSPRSSMDESPKLNPEDTLNQNSTDESLSNILSTPKTVTINFSSLAKPFEKTDNLYRLKETLTSTETVPTTPKISSRGTYNYKNSVEVVRSSSNDKNNKKVVSLTSGFSIRRNLNNTFNPYTLTVLTRPLEDYDRPRKSPEPKNNQKNLSSLERYYYNNQKGVDAPEGIKESIETKDEILSNVSMRRKDASSEITSEEYVIPIEPHPTIRVKNQFQSEFKTTTKPTVGTTKYFLKTVIKRPAPFTLNNEADELSTENNLETNALIETAYQNTKGNNLNSFRTTLNQEATNSKRTFVEPYKTLDNLKNNNFKKETDKFLPTSRTTTQRLKQNNRIEESTTKKPLYYSYRVEDEIPNQTTEIFGGAVKNVIKAFFDNFASTSKPVISTTTSNPHVPIEVVNIGYQKKPFKYQNNVLVKNNIKHLQIVTEPTITKLTPNIDTYNFNKQVYVPNNDVSSTTPAIVTTLSYALLQPVTTPTVPERSTFNEYNYIKPTQGSYESKFNSLLSTTPENESSLKYKNIISNDQVLPQTNDRHVLNNGNVNVQNKLTDVETTKALTETELRPKLENEIATTTSTTKSTTEKFKTTTPTKSVSFPTRASRVNPAIKLAATVPGGGRRSYQSTSKCSSDNSLQANPKCNEIKYQRPSSTRGRGSAHYSTGGSEAPQQQQSNRGTPPTRSRPTLKPSTSIVSKTTEFVDIYNYPPRRPAPVYPQPTPDKTAAKCRKDVCLLPDCYCGGKDIPADLPVESVPQIVLLTFDDSVNDLNKGLYSDLFEKGRINPNGCPISATFYVSHEWTDYSQVQNLYAAGHEIASHTVSHSFGEQFSQKKWNREVGGQREILSAYGGVKLEDVRGMRAPFLSVGGNKMFKMLYDSNFTYDSSLPVYENRPPSWPYTLDYKLFHDCMIPPCPTKSYPGVWEVPMVMWQDLNGGRCSMGDACANPSDAEGVYKMILKNFDRHYTTNRAPFGLYYHAAYFTQPHHKEGFIMFLDFINRMKDVWIVTNWQALQWVRDPTPVSRLGNFQPFQCDYQDRPKKCNNPKVCNLWHKSGVRYMRSCQPCPEVYPWTGKTGIRSSRIDNDIEE